MGDVAASGSCCPNGRCVIPQGDVEIRLGSIQAICETLGVSTSELFKGL
jgi:hypothetical protein